MLLILERLLYSCCSYLRGYYAHAAHTSEATILLLLILERLFQKIEEQQLRSHVDILLSPPESRHSFVVLEMCVMFGSQGQRWIHLNIVWKSS